jgi:hypothetical protein
MKKREKYEKIMVKLILEYVDRFGPAVAINTLVQHLIIVADGTNYYPDEIHKKIDHHWARLQSPDEPEFMVSKVVAEA